MVPPMKYGSCFITIVLLTVCTFQLFGEDTIKKIDGDTLKVAFVDPPPGIRAEESVRLLGIDAPQINTSAESDAFAPEAREFVISYIADSTVSQTFESYFHQSFVAIKVVARSESRVMWTTPMTGNIVIRQVYNEGRAEYVELWNRSAQTVNISDWYLLDNQQNRIEIPLDTSIPGNERLLVVSGSGPPPSSNYVQTTKASIWNNAGDTAKLYDGDGELVAEYSY